MYYRHSQSTYYGKYPDYVRGILIGSFRADAEAIYFIVPIYAARSMDGGQQRGRNPKLDGKERGKRSGSDVDSVTRCVRRARLGKKTATHI